MSERYLIRLIWEKEVLWNTDSHDHHDEGKINQAWEEVAAAFIEHFENYTLEEKKAMVEDLKSKSVGIVESFSRWREQRPTQSREELQSPMEDSDYSLSSETESDSEDVKKILMVVNNPGSSLI